MDLRTWVEGHLGPLEAALELPSVGSLVSYADRGFGTAIVPVLGAARFPAGLVRRNLDGIIPPLELRLCVRRKSAASRAAFLLAEAIRGRAP